MSGIAEKPVVLVVDDTPTNIQVLAEALRVEYRVKVAGGGMAALGVIARQGPPDLILLDVMMPEMDGYEVLRRLKGDPATRDVPVIFVTAKHESEDEEFGLRLGAVDYITKPFHLPIVMARVRNHVTLKMKTDLLETYAMLDGLTSVPNRRRFDEALESEWKRALRAGTSLALIMIDIDHFKAYNDSHGHGAGDVCLQRVAAALTAAVVRPGDLMARYGGEEFVALLPETDEKDACRIAGRMREQVAALRIPHGASSVSDWVTISAGLIAAVPSADGMPADLLGEADRQLYRAKEGGRNGISCRHCGEE